jgi:hypothetical protein
MPNNIPNGLQTFVWIWTLVCASNSVFRPHWNAKKGKEPANLILVHNPAVFLTTRDSPELLLTSTATTP